MASKQRFAPVRKPQASLKPFPGCSQGLEGPSKCPNSRRARRPSHIVARASPPAKPSSQRDNKPQPGCVSTPRNSPIEPTVLEADRDARLSMKKTNLISRDTKSVHGEDDLVGLKPDTYCRSPVSPETMLTSGMRPSYRSARAPWFTICAYRSPRSLSNRWASRSASIGSRSYDVRRASLSQQETPWSAKISWRLIPIITAIATISKLNTQSSNPKG